MSCSRALVSEAVPENRVLETCWLTKNKFINYIFLGCDRPPFCPGFLPGLVPEIVPEIVPEVVLEVVPGDVPEFLPEVLPEVLH